MEIIKCKVFLGDMDNNADEEFNEWMATHNTITFIDYIYKMSNNWNYSICVFYKED